MITDLMGLIGDLQAKLLQYGNLDVVVQDRECNILPIHKIEYREADEGEFPADWNMPEGFKFIQINAD